MGLFREFINGDQFVESLLNEFDNLAVQPQQPTGKVWSAKKSDILNIWKNQRPDLPIVITPMDDKGGQETYGEDGIRITGTYNFIVSVLGRIKDLLAHENNQTKLRLVFRGIEGERAARPDRQSYVFYANLENRGKHRPGRPRKTTIASPPTTPTTP